jgi:hypothetical protein
MAPRVLPLTTDFWIQRVGSAVFLTGGGAPPGDDMIFQVFEAHGNRAIYQWGSKAVSGLPDDFLGKLSSFQTQQPVTVAGLECQSQYMTFVVAKKQTGNPPWNAPTPTEEKSTLLLELPSGAVLVPMSSHLFAASIGDGIGSGAVVGGFFTLLAVLMADDRIDTTIPPL